MVGLPSKMNLCSVKGCDNPERTKTYCNGHYKRVLKYGDPGSATIRRKRRSNAGLICSIDYCNLPLYRMDYCSGHYQRIKNDGYPGDTPIRKTRERFNARRTRFDQGLWDRYKLSVEDYMLLLKQQGNVCAICKTDNAVGKNWHVDHDHQCCAGRKTCGNCIRGILCSPCNVRLGYIETYLLDPGTINEYISNGWWTK